MTRPACRRRGHGAGLCALKTSRTLTTYGMPFPSSSRVHLLRASSASCGSGGVGRFISKLSLLSRFSLKLWDHATDLDVSQLIHRKPECSRELCWLVLEVWWLAVINPLNARLGQRVMLHLTGCITWVTTLTAKQTQGNTTSIHGCISCNLCSSFISITQGQ